jgi:hypothetical protein
VYLYRFEVILEDGVVPVIIVAENDDRAFGQVDVELEKHFLRVPAVEEITLHEKKRIGKGCGFVLHPASA